MVSVIIPTYKRSYKIIQSIKSIINQDYTQNIEVIVVDDNGENEYTKQTEEELKYFISKGIIKYIKHKENLGACIARNTGAKFAKGVYLFFLDDDDIFLPNKVKVQIEFLQANDRYDGCLSAFKRIDDNGKEIVASSNYPSIGSFTYFTVKGNFFTPMLCIRKSSFEKIGGFKDIPRFQDRYFMLHCLKDNMKFAEIKEQLYIMHEHSGDRITDSSISKSIESLDTIKRYLLQYKELYSKKEWGNFIEKDNNMRATIYYLSGSYSKRLVAFKYWSKCLLKRRKFSYLKKLIKAIIPNIKIRKYIKRLYYRLKSNYTTEHLVEKGLKVGSNFHRMHDVILDPSHCWLIQIGNNVTMAPHVHILAHDASFKHYLGYARIGNVLIGNNVFIGADTVVLPGVSIGNNVIVGANSTITKNIKSNVVIAGSPAKVICSIDDFLKKNTIKDCPLYEENYTIRAGITTEMKHEMYNDLLSSRFGFVR